MTTIDAVYRDGAFHPTTPQPFAEGEAVRLTIVEVAPAASVELDPTEVLARILATAAKARKEGDNPNVTSRNVDEVLYGGPGGAR